MVGVKKGGSQQAAGTEPSCKAGIYPCLAEITAALVRGSNWRREGDAQCQHWCPHPGHSHPHVGDSASPPGAGQALTSIAGPKLVRQAGSLGRRREIHEN